MIRQAWKPDVLLFISARRCHSIIASHLIIRTVSWVKKSREAGCGAGGRTDVSSWAHLWEAYQVALKITPSSSIPALTGPLSIHVQGLPKTQLFHEAFNSNPTSRQSPHSALVPIPVFLKLEHAYPSSGDLAKNANSDSVGLGWGLILSLSDKLPNDLMLLVHWPNAD